MASPVFHGLAGAGLAYAMAGGKGLPLFASGRRTGAFLASGAALAYAVARDQPKGFDTMIAVYPDGRAYGWQQFNDKTPERGVMD